ncbi:MAG TPA: ATP-binding protein, partial [Pyrinomonadaceae bacterium]|nr:ATP-binding protein [Pyrinomonadaceae bacterium]
KDGTVVFADVDDLSGYQELVGRTMQSGAVELELNSSESALAARQFQTSEGTEYTLIIRWTRPQPVQVFGETRLRYARWIGLLITALIVCYLLALYLTSPIRKLREAAQRLADGELDTRVADRVGRRGDELSGLARDFDLMAERIESLINSQKTLSRDISHELRSPLARLNVALEIAKKKANNETHPSLERIETESNRLNEMIGRLLTLSRLETGTDDFERTPVNLRKLVEQVAADAQFEAAAKGRSVKVLKLDECNLHGSESLLRSAVENVLRNALKYTHPETTVEVELEAKNGNASIVVRDHGGGVPEEQLKNLFRPFYRVSEARDRGSGGTGLGLAIT